jgi:hypothetical protein
VAEAFDVLDQSVGRRLSENLGLCDDISQSVRKAGQFLATPRHEFVLEVLAQSAACLRRRRHDIDDPKWRTALPRDLCRPLECRLRSGGSVDVHEMLVNVFIGLGHEASSHIR